MHIKLLLFLVGSGLSIIGFMYIITYLNLLTIGYNFLEYANFIIKRIECLYAPLGLFLIFVSIDIDKGDEYEIHI